MLDLNGFVSETNACNVFCVVGGRVLTPTADACLPGVTRGLVIQLCEEEGIVCEVGARGLLLGPGSANRDPPHNRHPDLSPPAPAPPVSGAQRLADGVCCGGRGLHDGHHGRADPRRHDRPSPDR